MKLELKTDPNMFVYPSLEDAGNRLNNVFLRYQEKEIILINGVFTQDDDHSYNKGIISAACLGSQKEIQIPLKEAPNVLSFENLNLGYCNYKTNKNKNNAIYAMRQPLRHTRQSISTNALKFIGYPNQLRITYSSPYLKDMFNKNYPSFEEAFEWCKFQGEKSEETDKVKVAVSSIFAINYNVELDEFFWDYKTKTIGRIDSENKQIKLRPKNYWLKETIEEEGFKNA